ncbi:hypothetical protein [Chryseobacterium scophthalmum]|uniref:hypothetical protein n=1 Tax=Chryseobacterium scophthalmum TaxID=59733 RepID=UPI003D08BF13
MNLDNVFDSAVQAPDIAAIIFEENISDPEEALEFICDNIGLGEYMDFMEAFNSEDNLRQFKERGYDHIIAGIARNKVEYCIFDPANITILNKNIMSLFPESAYLSITSPNSRQIENIIKALHSNEQREINAICKQLKKNLDSIPNVIDGIEMDNMKKLRILAGKDNTPTMLCYSISKGKLYRELAESLDGKSPVLKLSAEKVKNQGIRIPR